MFPFNNFNLAAPAFLFPQAGETLVIVMKKWSGGVMEQWSDAHAPLPILP